MKMNFKSTLRKCFYASWFVFLCLTMPVQAQKTVVAGAAAPFTIENYYKTRWGFADEFIQLWKKNHYPLLKKVLEHGDILSISAVRPLLHFGEDSRWDFKVIIVFKNVQEAFDPKLFEPFRKQLYPDTDKLVRDEQHRFELLIAHWDVPITNIDLNE